MQLHALLESILEFDNGRLCSHITVTYQGITSELQAGYEKLVKNPLFNCITFKPKSGSLSRDMLEVMGKEHADYFGVITDDCIFYRNFYLPESELDFLMHEKVNHLTFRCGFNTKVVDYMNPSYTEELKGRQITHDIVEFCWPSHNNHYGFPCALDGTVFNKQHILDATLSSVGIDFDYRRWECKVNEKLRATQDKPYALCFETSVLVNSPNNMVVENLYCKNGLQHKYTIEELNQRYLDNEKINIYKIKETKIDSVQMEVPFHFVKQ